MNILQDRDFIRDQAEGLIAAVKEIDTSELATKKDLEKSVDEIKIWTPKLLLGQIAIFTGVVALLLSLFLG